MDRGNYVRIGGDHAGEGTQTPDLLFTKQLLYRLSYTGIGKGILYWLITKSKLFNGE